MFVLTATCATQQSIHADFTAATQLTTLLVVVTKSRDSVAEAAGAWTSQNERRRDDVCRQTTDRRGADVLRLPAAGIAVQCAAATALFSGSCLHLMALQCF